tara:strand:- start:3213 stop:3887 length:675 start_codon:yes stop_codon:yes gene_type:complete
MNTIEKILNILKMKKEPKSYKVKMYAEMILDDGRVIATEDDQFEIGSKVFAINDDGDAEPLAAGEYTMENGSKMSINENSEIADLGEEADAPEEVEAGDDKEEMQDEDNIEKRLSALEKEIEEMKKKKDKMSEEVEEVEEMSSEEEVEETKEAEVEEKTEMASEDIIGELMTQVEELNSKIVELSGQPAEESITYNPEGNNVNSTIDLAKLSVSERAAYFINNK